MIETYKIVSIHSNPIQCVVTGAGSLARIVHSITITYMIQIGTLPVPVKSALKSKNTS